MKTIGFDHILRRCIGVSVLCLIVCGISAQSLTLQECYSLAELESPISGQTNLYERLATIKNEKLSAANRPQVDLNGQWTYQSAVLGLPVKLPNTEVPTIPNDQYQAHLSVEQTLFDGGITRRSKGMVQQELKANQQKVVAELYKVREAINTLFFGVLRSQENEKSLHEVLHTLRERKKVIDARYANGLLLLSDKAAFEKEMLSVEQQLVATETEKAAMINMLSDKIGTALNMDVELKVPENSGTDDLELNRPELIYFDAQKHLLDQNARLVRSRNTPRLSAFARGGLGSPNPLSPFETGLSNFYIAGVRLHWKLYDWGMNKREREQLVIQQEIVENSREDLARQFANGSLQWKQKLAVVDEVMDRDAEIIRLQESIVKEYESRLERGLITSSDYITALDQLTRAKITARMHEIDRSFYQVQYLTITGNL